MVVAIIDGLNINIFINSNGQSIIVAIAIVYTFIQCIRRYGFKSFLVFLGIVFVIGNIYENTSIATGFPFGNYYYTEQLGPKFIFTPLIINIAYFQMAYIVWNLTNVLIDNYKNRLSGFYIVLQPLVASFTMVMWDIVFDPWMSTMSKNWIWEDGGAYFGVPLSNFYGWFLCVFTMFLLFSIYTYKFQEKETPSFIYTKSYWLQNVLLYFSWVVLLTLKGYCIPAAQIIQDPSGQVWCAQQMCQVGGLMGLFTVGAICVIVICKVYAFKKLPGIKKLELKTQAKLNNFQH